MASVTVLTLQGAHHWKFAYGPKGAEATFEAYIPAPHPSRKNEWLQFLLGDQIEHSACFVLQEDNGYTAFTKSDVLGTLGFTHTTQVVPTSADVHVCAQMTPELLEQLRQLPFAE